MKELHSYTIRLADGRSFSLDSPQVMGILNVTPDSFYAGSRQQSEEEIGKRVRQIAKEGASMLDIGAYSSRPGADDVPIEEEMARLRRGLTIVKREAPDLVVSVDTLGLTWRECVLKSLALTSSMIFRAACWIGICFER